MPELGTSGSVGGPGWATTQVYPPKAAVGQGSDASRKLFQARQMAIVASAGHGRSALLAWLSRDSPQRGRHGSSRLRAFDLRDAE